MALAQNIKSPQALRHPATSPVRGGTTIARSKRSAAPGNRPKRQIPRSPPRQGRYDSSPVQAKRSSG